MPSIYEKFLRTGTHSFSARELRNAKELFRDRTALFFTPTERIPKCWVGSGVLDVRLPLPHPTFHELLVNRAHQIPRLWVEMLQRATWKIRWTPIPRPHLTVICHDIEGARFYDQGGAKAMVDALKVSTTGRYDGKRLHYFGAIVDDSTKVLGHGQLLYERRVVENPADGFCHIVVRPM